MAVDPGVLILYQVGLLIVIASIASGILKHFKLPGLIGAILVGLFIGGPGGLGLVTDLGTINILATLGAVLLLFSTGLEFDVSAFWKSGKTAFLLTTVGVVFTVVVGYLAGMALGWSVSASFLLGTALAPSGTSVVAAALGTRRASTRNGSMLLTACVVDDVEGIALLTIAYSMIVTGSFSALNLASTTLTSVLFIVGSLFLGSRLLPRAISRFENTVSEDTMFAVLLGFGLVFAFGATLVGLAAITGAFIVGAVVPYKTVGLAMSSQIRMMKDTFTVIFFTSIGLSINPFDILVILPLALVILAVAVGARLIGGFLGGAAGGLRGSSLRALTVALAVRGEISLIVAREAVALGIVEASFLALTATVVVGSVFVVLPIFARLSKVMDETNSTPTDLPPNSA